MRARTVDDIGRIARQRRLDEGRSQADVAEAAGVTRQWFVRFEQGRSDVSLRNVMAVLAELKLDLSISTQKSHAEPSADRATVPMIEWPTTETSATIERGRLMLERLLETHGHKTIRSLGGHADDAEVTTRPRPRDPDPSSLR